MQPSFTSRLKNSLVVETANTYSHQLRRNYLVMKAQLFGGAVSCELPDEVIDVAKFRQVPDNQEVFLIEKGDSTKQDKSVIIEILEQPNSNIEQSLETHLSDLLEIEVLDIQAVLREEPMVTLKYEQFTNEISDKNFLTLFKYNPKNILVVYALVRVDRAQCDFLISLFINLSNPDYEDIHDKSLTYIIENYRSLNINRDIKTVETAAKSIIINNWSLFA